MKENPILLMDGHYWEDALSFSLWSNMHRASNLLSLSEECLGFGTTHRVKEENIIGSYIS